MIDCIKSLHLKDGVQVSQLWSRLGKLQMGCCGCFDANLTTDILAAGFSARHHVQNVCCLHVLYCKGGCVRAQYRLLICGSLDSDSASIMMSPLHGPPLNDKQLQRCQPHPSIDQDGHRELDRGNSRIVEQFLQNVLIRLKKSPVVPDRPIKDQTFVLPSLQGCRSMGCHLRELLGQMKQVSAEHNPRSISLEFLGA